MPAEVDTSSSDKIHETGTTTHAIGAVGKMTDSPLTLHRATLCSGPEYSDEMDISGVASIIGALGIGSFAGQYLIGSQQRRQLRSDVLRYLAITERTRWAGASSSDSSFQQFKDSIRELETAAIIARVPRRPLRLYIQLATAARLMSDDDVEQKDGQEEAGGINTVLGRSVRWSAAQLSRLMWSPWLARAGMKRRASAIEREVQGLDEEVVSAVDKAKQFHTYY